MTAQLVDIPSVSRAERVIADAVEHALRALPHLAVSRDGDAVVARTELGRAELSLADAQPEGAAAATKL